MERANFRAERANFKPKRADSGLEGQISSLRGLMGRDKWMELWKKGQTEGKTEVPLCSKRLRPLRGRYIACKKHVMQFDVQIYKKTCVKGPSKSLTEYDLEMQMRQKMRHPNGCLNGRQL